MAEEDKVKGEMFWVGIEVWEDMVVLLAVVLEKGKAMKSGIGGFCGGVGWLEEEKCTIGQVVEKEHEDRNLWKRVRWEKKIWGVDMFGPLEMGNGILESVTSEVMSSLEEVPEMRLINTIIDLNLGKLFVESPSCKVKLEINLDQNLPCCEKEELELLGQRYQVQGYDEEVNMWFAEALARPYAWKGKYGPGQNIHVDAMRFRPNLIISGAEPYEEDSWRRLTIGGAYFTSLGGCNRCEMINLDFQSGEVRKSKEPLATLASFRRVKVITASDMLMSDNDIADILQETFTPVIFFRP
ncbi:Molybdenum cofactor sulfurase [Acorus gramineus]|uniref:Molybdenum cofactor sulfurase n=1 Tax=Acorus gramineus TaxID=55184 RepID=A0AAV9BQM9_ACOGR|nr:Molybdenum cofactor sulfurase [Acorus gramineus]